MSDYPQTPQNQVRRIPQRAAYDAETIYQIVDASPICHIGFVVDGQPYVIPTIHARQDDALIFHGAVASRLLKHIQAGQPICVTVTLLDGLVLARSVFHHSMNYRSVVLFGRGEMVDDAQEKMATLEILTEKIMPGRWADARQPSTKELAATTVVKMTIDSASAKVRTGGPVDDEEDYDLNIWAGVLPLQLIPQSLQPDERLQPNTDVPAYLETYIQDRS